MTDELLRCAVWLPLAVLLPQTTHGHAPRALRSGLAAVLAASGLTVTLSVPLGVAAVAAAAVLAALPPATGGAPAARETLGARRLAIAGVGALALLLVALASSAAAWRAVVSAATADDAWFVLGVGVACSVLGAPVLGFVLSPLSRRLETGGRPVGISAGRTIGVLERGLLFALLLGGLGSAAGLTVAAKAIARFPALGDEREGYAEYVLVGTLASVALATVAAALTRAALGLPALR